MTVRRRVTGPLAAFLAAAAFVGSARAQQPFPFEPFPFPPPGGDPRARGLTPDEVKARIEWFLNRDKAGGNLPQGMDPRQLAEMLKQLGLGPDKNGKIDPQQLEFFKRLVEQNPDLRRQLEQMRREGKLPPGPQDFGKGPGPLDPGFKDGDFKFPPNGFKVDPPVKRPTPPDVAPPKRFPPPPPDPVPPDGKADPFPPPFQKNTLPPPVRERAPWEEPESPQEKARQAAAALWEKNVGPLDETPAVRKALFDLAEGTGDLKDPDGNSLWESLSKEFGDGKSLGDLLDGVETGEGWKMPDWEFPKLNWNLNWGNNSTPKLDPGAAGPPRESWWSRWRRSPSTPSSSSSPSSWFGGWRAPRWNVGIPSLDGTLYPFLFLVAVLGGGVFLWWWLSRRAAEGVRIDPYALGPWPVDPHHLASRQDVVVAFEHLSVLICGPVAKTWTHTTIAGALSELATAEPRRALMLARLYELARYAPVEEPLTTAELAEARRLVCRLAGFSDD